MTADAQTAGAAVNPLDPDAFAHGGGLWDGKTVTITSAVAKTEALKYGDGKPVLGKDGNQSYQTALYVKGIADGGDDKERHEEYSVGDRLVPTPDGEGFTTKDGSPLKFHANSNFAKLSAALKAAGFDIGSLLARDASGAIVYLAPGIPKQQFSKLVGARFVFKGEPKLGKDGKPVKDKKGYDKSIHLPVRFVGYAASVAAGKPGNGAAAPTGNGASNGLAEKAESAVIAALTAAPGNALTRAQLIQALAAQLKGDPESNAVIGVVVRDDFHEGKAWKYDGKQASL